MELAHIPLEQLKVSTLNMRHGRKSPDITDILPSIRARGVQQPLLVRKNGKGYEIVAGRRRFFSLKQIAKESGKIAPIPCAIMAAGDAAAQRKCRPSPRQSPLSSGLRLAFRRRIP